MAYTTINKSTEYFNTKLYTGNGSTNNITGVGFQPDWLWIKSRGATENHVLYDAIRGVTKQLYSNTSGAESTNATALTAFASDGFNLATTNTNTNANGANFVSWNWKANGQGSSNTAGTINTTYTSANTTAGFSIIKYAGTGSSGTIGHGLSATPRVCIFKEIDGTEGWRVWHRAAPNYSTKALKLNTSDAEFSQSNWIGTVDNSIITLGTDSSINTYGNNYICYTFAEKTGYSKFGKYSGNSNADGSFIYLGFKPSFIMVKRTDTGNSYDNWIIYDNKRSGYNPDNDRLHADITDAENNDNTIDIVSNGFKIRSANSNLNGGSHIYMAFGQSLVGSNNVPCTAR